MQSNRPMYTGLVRFMVLNVTRLRNRGFTRRCEPLFELPFVPLANPFPAWFCGPSAPVFDAPFDAPFALPIFEKHARIMAGGNPARADWGYSPRSATSIAEGSKSLPTM